MPKMSHEKLDSAVRNEWSTPRLSRLTASEAELSLAGSLDLEGMS